MDKIKQFIKENNELTAKAIADIFGVSVSYIGTTRQKMIDSGEIEDKNKAASKRARQLENQILETLKKEPMTKAQLAKRFKTTEASINNRLNAVRERGTIFCKKHGKAYIYSAPSGSVGKVETTFGKVTQALTKPFNMIASA